MSLSSVVTLDPCGSMYAMILSMPTMSLLFGFNDGTCFTPPLGWIFGRHDAESTHVMSRSSRHKTRKVYTIMLIGGGWGYSVFISWSKPIFCRLQNSFEFSSTASYVAPAQQIQRVRPGIQSNYAGGRERVHSVRVRVRVCTDK